MKIFGTMADDLIFAFFQQPWWIRYLAGAFVGTILLGVVPDIWSKVKTMSGEQAGSPAEKQPVNVLGNNNVISVNQSGGIAAHTVNQAPPPQLRQLSTSLAENSDGTYTTSFMFEVVAPYPPGNLSLEVHAATIISLDMVPQRAGIHMSGHTGKRDGFAFTNLHSPFGKYLMTVRTGKQEQLVVNYSFQ